MTSQLNVDTIKGKTAETSITIQGEGSATTNLQQGVVKVWINFDGTGTPSSRDSFNVGSITDNGTGSYDIVFTNAMGNANYTTQCSLNNGTTDVSGAHDYGFAIVDRATGTYRIDIENASNTQTDLSLTDTIIHGDLA